VRTRAALALALALLALAAAGPASAAGPPAIEATWVESVTATSANLRARVDPKGLTTRYHFEYLTEAAYYGSGESFASAAHKPTGEGALVPAAGIAILQHIEGLAPETAYYYRVVATNSAAETSLSPPRLLVTEQPTSVHPPIDGRGWEMVSPVDKGGGAIAAPGSLFGGGDFQAAVSSQASALTYGSATAFGEAAGSPPSSQYLSRRTVSGWSTQNISEPLESGSYGDEPDGAPYRLFSEDLSRALVLNPRRCETGEPCPRSYSLRESASGVLTPLGAEADGMRVAGASPDLGRIWFEDEGGAVFEWSGAALVPSTAPPVPGTERVSADGQHRLFVSAAEIPPFDNIDADSGEPDTEVYLEGPPPGGGASRLVCVSCNPTGERPHGSSTIPGALINGSTAVYEPRVLSASGNRVFFDTSDRLVSADSNGRPDVYEWEASGEGNCTRSPGCVDLISGGRGAGGIFLDASADGADVYFITGESLVSTDSGSIDAYDYRIGGGFPEPQAPFACNGDACQALPGEPEDPSPGTLVKNEGNPKQKYYSEPEHGRRCPKGKHRVKRHGKVRCVRRHRHPERPHSGGSR
jgi:hypothetical protein